MITTLGKFDSWAEYILCRAEFVEALEEAKKQNPDLPSEFVHELLNTIKQHRSSAEPFSFSEEE